MRGSGQGGRFDLRYEVDSMYEGMTDDLYDPVGMVLQWHIYEPTLTKVDPLFDIGDPATGGRKWTGPYPVPALGIRVFQGQTMQNDHGFYVGDVMHAIFNVGQISEILRDIISEPDHHLKDRFEYRGELWEPTKIYYHGAVGKFMTVVSMDAIQIKGDQIVNDTQWTGYADA